MILGALPQRFSQSGDVDCEVAFFDDCVGPDAGEQHILFHYLAAVFDQDEEGVEDLGSDGYGLAIPQKKPPFDVDLELPKDVNGCLRRVHKWLVSKSITKFWKS